MSSGFAQGVIRVLAAGAVAAAAALPPAAAAAVPFEAPVVLADSYQRPADVASTDIDGDGDTDLLFGASFEFGSRAIGLFLNNGGKPPTLATFVNPVTSSTPAGVSAVLPVDLNGDGHVDIVSASEYDPQLRSFVNDGGNPARFAYRVLVANDVYAIDVDAADIDGDGDLDFVVASPYLGTISWLANDGGSPATFTPHLIASVANPAAVSIADLDGDGHPDVVAAVADENRVAWYRNDGAVAPEVPAFTAGTVTDAAPAARAVSVGDLDGDGDHDVAAASPGDASVVWFDNDGNPVPAFTERVVISDPDGPGTGVDGPINEVSGAIAVDLDGDGDRDLAVFSQNGNVYAWIENRSCSTGFPTQADVGVSTPDGATSVEPADLDGDGDLDVVVASANDSTIAWYRNDGAAIPTFSEIPIDSAVQRASAVAAADVDGDGHLDVLAAGARTNSVTWYRNDGAADPAFSAMPISSTVFSARSVRGADVDGDGDTDVLAASSAEDRVVWFENDGATPPGWTEHDIDRSADGAWSVWTADLDGDGDTDVLSASINDGKIAWYRNDGGSPPSFTTFVVVARDGTLDLAGFADGALQVRAADLDRDGDVDIVSASAYDDKVAWYENVGGSPPEFVERIITQDPDGSGPLQGPLDGAASIATGDVDGDGDPDLVAVSVLNNTVAWFENDGLRPATFFIRKVPATIAAGRSAAIADLNRDGAADLVTGSYRDDRIAWFANTTDELCAQFDVNGDGVIDGAELAWIGRAFGLDLAKSPGGDWWRAVDYSRDLAVDGKDLSILGSTGVWGKSVFTCSFTCPAGRR